MIKTVLIPTVIAGVASWATIGWLLGRLESEVGPGVFTNEIAVATIIFCQAGVIFTADWRALSGNYWVHRVTIVITLWALASVWWSANKSYSLLELILVVTCTLSFIAVASKVGPMAMFIGLLLNIQLVLLFAFLSDEAPLKDGGFLLYPGKLAPLLLIGICISLGLLLSHTSQRPYVNIKRIALLAVLGLDSAALLHSESETGKFVLLFVIFISLAFASTQILMRRNEKKRPIDRLFSTALVTGLGAAFLLMRFTPGNFLGLTIDTSFTGRTVLWSAAWEGTQSRVWIGWGWVAGWFDPTFRDTVLPFIGDRAPRFYWSHSTWLDLSLSFGLLGLIVLAALFVFVVLTADMSKHPSHTVSMLLVSALALQLMFESLHRDMHFAFGTFMFAMLVLNGTFSRVERDQSSNSS